MSERIVIDQEKKTRNTKNFICPHCQTEQSDSWEIDTNDDMLVHECGSCLKPFAIWQLRQIIYYAAPILKS